MAEQKKRTKEQRKARRKAMESSPLKKIVELEKTKLALESRIADLEAVLSPLVWQLNRYAIAMKGARPDQTVTLTHRVGFLRKMREVLANNRHKPQVKNYPEFETIARHTIEDFGKSLLDIGTLADEMRIAYEAGYEHRRSEELARAHGERVD